MPGSPHDSGTRKIKILRNWQRKSHSKVSWLSPIKVPRRYTVNSPPLMVTSEKLETPDRLPLLDYCARHDAGGGVSLSNGTFAIYSTARLPSFWEDTLQQQSRSISRLAAAASAIIELIPIYTSWVSLPVAELLSLPCPPEESDPLSQKPWFLINAAEAHSHCIVGRHHLIETLLVVLRRPWCVLEICCSNLLVISAVLQFAVIAKDIDYKGYTAAISLLSHEKCRREILSLGGDRMLPVELHSSGASMADLRDVGTAIFVPSTRSYNAFWIGLICVCAVKLNLTCSATVRALGAQKDGARVLSHDGSKDHRRNNSAGSHLQHRLSRQQIPNARRCLRKSSSAVELRLSEHETCAPSDDFTTYLLSVYADTLKALVDFAS